MFCKCIEPIWVLQACPSVEVIEACEGHGIHNPLEINRLFPFNLLVCAVVDEHIRHVISDHCLELFWDVRHKALFVGRQWRCQLLLIWFKSPGLVELVLEPFDWLLALAWFDDQSFQLGWVQRFLLCSCDVDCSCSCSQS